MTLATRAGRRPSPYACRTRSGSPRTFGSGRSRSPRTFGCDPGEMATTSPWTTGGQARDPPEVRWVDYPRPASSTSPGSDIASTPSSCSRGIVDGSSAQASTSSSAIADQPRTTSRAWRGVGEDLPLGVLAEDPVGERGAALVVDRAELVVAARGRAHQREVDLVGWRPRSRRTPPARPPAARAARPRPAGRSARQVVGRAADDGLVEVLLVAEVVVEQAARDAGLLGEHVDRELVERAGRRAGATPRSSSCVRRCLGREPGACGGRGHGHHPIDAYSITPIAVAA